MPVTRGQHLIGKELGGCTLEALLGYGGSSAVFLAQQHEPERKVAIKVFMPQSGMDSRMLQDFYTRFLQEADAASHLDHPGILPIYSYGEQDGYPYIIMPYMAGGTLRQYISRHGCLSLNEAQWYLEQVASALDYAHEHGCVHCDVKPANLLLDGEGLVILSDFGIAHIMQPDVVNGDAQVAAQGPEMLMGTPDYISPEQALGQPLDGRSDVYSLGITLFFLLAGRLPFKADSTIAMALQHVHEPPPSLALLRADVTPAIDAVIHKALAKQPEERFQTAGAFAAAFSQAINTSGAIYQHEIKEKLALLQAGEGQDEEGRILIASRPIVRVRPAWHSHRRLSRLIAVVSILFLLIAGSALTAGIVTSHFTSRVHIIPTAGPLALTNGNSGSTLIDDLTDDSDWPTSSTFFFNNQQYHIQNKSAHYVALALYSEHRYTNFRVIVTMTEVAGSLDGADYYGVVFRSADDQSHYYLFEVAAWGGGVYQFSRYDGQWQTLAAGSTSALLTKKGQPNTLTIEAKGNTFKFFINKKAVGNPFTDKTKASLSGGEIGLYVEEQGTEVAFSHLYIASE